MMKFNKKQKCKLANEYGNRDIQNIPNRNDSRNVIEWNYFNSDGGCLLYFVDPRGYIVASWFSKGHRPIIVR